MKNREDLELCTDEVAYIAIYIFGAMQKQEELSSFLDVLSKARIHNILEIGAGNGGTSWAFSKLCHSFNLLSIDKPDGQWGNNRGGPSEQIVNHITTYSNCNYQLIRKDSKDPLLLEFLQLKLREFDLLFIDGDHSYEGVKADFNNYSPFVRSGGIIAFHDICEHAPETGCEVKRFWDELNPDDFEAKREIISEPTTWGGIGYVIKK